MYEGLALCFTYHWVCRKMYSVYLSWHPNRFLLHVLSDWDMFLYLQNSHTNLYLCELSKIQCFIIAFYLVLYPDCFIMVLSNALADHPPAGGGGEAGSSQTISSSSQPPQPRPMTLPGVPLQSYTAGGQSAIQHQLQSPPLSPTRFPTPGPLSPSSLPSIQHGAPTAQVISRPGSPSIMNGPLSPTATGNKAAPDSNLIKSLLANKVAQNLHRLQQQQQPPGLPVTADTQPSITSLTTGPPVAVDTTGNSEANQGHQTTAKNEVQKTQPHTEAPPQPDTQDQGVVNNQSTEKKATKEDNQKQSKPSSKSSKKKTSSPAKPKSPKAPKSPVAKPKSPKNKKPASPKAKPKPTPAPTNQPQPVPSQSHATSVVNVGNFIGVAPIQSQMVTTTAFLGPNGPVVASVPTVSVAARENGPSLPIQQVSSVGSLDTDSQCSKDSFDLVNTLKDPDTASLDISDVLAENESDLLQKACVLADLPMEDSNDATRVASPVCVNQETSSTQTSLPAMANGLSSSARSAKQDLSSSESESVPSPTGKHCNNLGSKGLDGQKDESTTKGKPNKAATLTFNGSFHHVGNGDCQHIPASKDISDGTAVNSTAVTPEATDGSKMQIMGDLPQTDGSGDSKDDEEAPSEVTSSNTAADNLTDIQETEAAVSSLGMGQTETEDMDQSAADPGLVSMETVEAVTATLNPGVESGDPVTSSTEAMEVTTPVPTECAGESVKSVPTECADESETVVAEQPLGEPSSSQEPVANTQATVSVPIADLSTTPPLAPAKPQTSVMATPPPAVTPTSVSSAGSLAGQVQTVSMPISSLTMPQLRLDNKPVSSASASVPPPQSQTTSIIASQLQAPAILTQHSQSFSTGHGTAVQQQQPVLYSGGGSQPQPQPSTVPAQPQMVQVPVSQIHHPPTSSHSSQQHVVILPKPNPPLSDSQHVILPKPTTTVTVASTASQPQPPAQMVIGTQQTAQQPAVMTPQPMGYPGAPPGTQVQSSIAGDQGVAQQPYGQSQVAGPYIPGAAPGQVISQGTPPRPPAPGSQQVVPVHPGQQVVYVHPGQQVVYVQPGQQVVQVPAPGTQPLPPNQGQAGPVPQGQPGPTVQPAPVQGQQVLQTQQIVQGQGATVVQGSTTQPQQPVPPSQGHVQQQHMVQIPQGQQIVQTQAIGGQQIIQTAQSQVVQGQQPVAQPPQGHIQAAQPQVIKPPPAQGPVPVGQPQMVQGQSQGQQQIVQVGAGQQVVQTSQGQVLVQAPYNSQPSVASQASTPPQYVTQQVVQTSQGQQQVMSLPPGHYVVHRQVIQTSQGQQVVYTQQVMQSQSPGQPAGPRNPVVYTQQGQPVVYSQNSQTGTVVHQGQTYVVQKNIQQPSNAPVIQIPNSTSSSTPQPSPIGTPPPSSPKQKGSPRSTSKSSKKRPPPNKSDSEKPPSKKKKPPSSVKSRSSSTDSRPPSCNQSVPSSGQPSPVIPLYNCEWTMCKRLVEREWLKERLHHVY